MSVSKWSANCLLSKYLRFSRICSYTQPKYKWGDLSGVPSITHASLLSRIATRRSRHIRRLLRENGNTQVGGCVFALCCQRRRLLSRSRSRSHLPSRVCARERGDGGWEIATQLTMQDDSRLDFGRGICVWERETGVRSLRPVWKAELRMNWEERSSPAVCFRSHPQNLWVKHV